MRGGRLSQDHLFPRPPGRAFHLSRAAGGDARGGAGAEGGDDRPGRAACGAWSEADYLWLTNQTNRLVEYTDGRLESLPMPTDEHETRVVRSALEELALLPSGAHA